VYDRRVLKLVRRFLNPGVMTFGLVSPSRFIERRLKLKVTLEKSAVSQLIVFPWGGGPYQGFSFTSRRDNPPHPHPLEIHIYHFHALLTGCSRKGEWRMSKVKWVVIAMPNAYFDQLGLFLPGPRPACSAGSPLTDPYEWWPGRGEPRGFSPSRSTFPFLLGQYPLSLVLRYSL
jgi:hypothetical protein